MTKSNLIVVDFRPQARLASIEELDSRLEAIDAAVATAYARACEIEAEAANKARARDADLEDTPRGIGLAFCRLGLRSRTTLGR